MKSIRIPSGGTYYAQEHNALRSDAVASSWLHVHQQLGALALGTAPTNGQTVTLDINGTNIVFTAITGSPTNPGDVKAPGTAAGFVANLISLLQNPTTTTATGIAIGIIGSANVNLVSYVGWALPSGGTTITPFSLNTSTYAPLTSFSASTTVTSGTWTGQTMQLYVQPGTFYINGTRALFLGTSTPTVTAPVSNPRIDVLTIDPSGTLAWTTGTESASPVAPTYPSDKLALCELFNVVGETALYDVDNQQSGQGFIQSDVRPALSIGPILTAIASDLVADATDSRNLGSDPGSSGNEWNNLFVKQVIASSAVKVGGVNISLARFGGTGIDGALTITSGTTTINLGGANVFVKNYTSISITGTGALAFSNPHANGTNIILKSQGNVTITSSANPCIDVGGMGTAGGAAGTGTGTTNAIGPTASGGSSMVAQGAQSNASNSSGSAGGPSSAAFGLLNWLFGATAPISVPVASPINGVPFAIALTIKGKTINICPSTGGSGSGGNNQSGTPQNGNVGGAGAGALYIECAGFWNFTQTINANGVAGGTNTSRSGNGGGGAGGIVLVVYEQLTANTGTINTNGAGSPAGANGASLVIANDEFP